MELSGVKAVVAVASGKGGVGKSTVAVNLAVACALAGRRVGLLDADIYGPSLHRMMNLATAKPLVDSGKLLLPPENYGVKCLSMGMMVKEDSATIWRGPMVMGALEQMLRQTRWAPLDLLLLDMPPGTGDAYLTAAQRVLLAGAVVVTTPQDIALLDVRRGISMFRTMQVPVLGIVENMSHFDCPACGHRAHLFGSGGGSRTAQTFSTELLGQVPLQEEVMQSGEAGSPVALRPETPAGAVFAAIAARVLELLDRPAAELPAAPVISKAP
jgi:ATP-binding protein involved in chromosome partitioning